MNVKSVPISKVKKKTQQKGFSREEWNTRRTVTSSRTTASSTCPGTRPTRGTCRPSSSISATTGAIDCRTVRRRWKPSSIRVSSSLIPFVCLGFLSFRNDRDQHLLGPPSGPSQRRDLQSGQRLPSAGDERLALLGNGFRSPTTHTDELQVHVVSLSSSFAICRSPS